MHNINPMGTLPMKVGYDIGHIIHKNEILLADLKPKYDEAEKELIKSSVQRLNLCTEYKKDGKLPAKGTNDFIVYEVRLARVERELNAAVNNYKAIGKQIENTKAFRGGEDTKKKDTKQHSLPISWSVPFDLSHVTIEKFVGKESEATERFVVRSGEGPLIRQKLQLLLNTIFSNRQEIISGFFNPEALDLYADALKGETETAGPEKFLSVIGSFYEIPARKVLKKIQLIQPVQIDEELLKNCSDYYVLTESLFGAVFIGAQMSYIEGKLPKSVYRETSMVSWISQGVILDLEKPLNSLNLDEVYSQWRKNVLKSQSGGYPVGYKYRNLKSILLENKVTLQNK